MKFTATGATDGASIVLFWPENLPDDADDLLQDDPAALIERMHSVGKLVAFPCDADGEHSLGVFLDEEIPPKLLAYCQDVEHMPRLIASGDGYFGGVEYLFKNDASLLKQYPGMCQQLQIPAGTYRASVYRTHLPSELHDAWVLEQAGSRAVRVWEWQTTLVGLSIALVFAVFVAWLFIEWMIWYGIIIAAAITIFAAMGIARTAPYQAVVAAREEFKRTFPNYVLQLESPGRGA